uniref:uncharacterized protein n=1 Tax=Myxine glutinosa TaxID=7769 RepID=UPI00358EC308
MASGPCPNLKLCSSWMYIPWKGGHGPERHHKSLVFTKTSPQLPERYGPNLVQYIRTVFSWSAFNSKLIINCWIGELQALHDVIAGKLIFGLDNDQVIWLSRLLTGSSLSNKYILVRMSVIRQTYLLCWKNWRSFVHSPVLPLAVVIWPCIVAIIVTILRAQEERIYEPNCYLPPQSLPSSGFLPFVESLVCDWELECQNQPEGEHPRRHRHTRSADSRGNENFLEVLRSFGKQSTLINGTNRLKQKIQKLVDSFEQRSLKTNSMEELTQFIRHVHQTFYFSSKQNPEGISGRHLKKVLCESLLPNNQTNLFFSGEVNVILQRWCLTDDPLVVVVLEAFEMVMKNEAFSADNIVMDLLAGNSSILDKLEEWIVWLEEAHSWSGLWRILLRWLGNTRFHERTWNSPMEVIGETIALLEDIWEAADSFPWRTNLTVFQPAMEGLIKTLRLTLQKGLSAKGNHSAVSPGTCVQSAQNECVKLCLTCVNYRCKLTLNRTLTTRQKIKLPKVFYSSIVSMKLVQSVHCVKHDNKPAEVPNYYTQ